MQRADEVWGKTLVFRNEIVLPPKALKPCADCPRQYALLGTTAVAHSQPWRLESAQ